MNKLQQRMREQMGPHVTLAGGLYPAHIPLLVVSRDQFSEAARTMKFADARLVAEWAADDTLLGRGFAVYACFNADKEFLIVRADIPVDTPSFPTLKRQYTSAHRFERQIRSLMGVDPTGLFDQRPWIKHEDWPEDAFPLRKSFDAKTQMARVTGEYRWIRVEGEGVYEIPVGPVHAGIIEPGHFRFHANGEDILNLEERLGYVHKGIEKRFEALSWEEGARLAGRVSGDTTAAHTLCYCRAVEALTGTVVPDRALMLRAVMLERERIANHLGDIGAICNDVGFAFMLFQCHTLKEYFVRTNLRLFGHRFMMDCIVPGGVCVNIDPGGIREMIEELGRFAAKFEHIETIYDNNPSLEDRLRDTGVLSREMAKDLGVVGIVARASGQALDSRIQSPFPPYDRIIPKLTVLKAGDVNARTWVRIEEIRESVRLLKQMLEDMPEGEVKTPMAAPAPDQCGFAVVEGWRGEIATWVQSDLSGAINRCMVRDPSSLTWLGLEQCVHGNIVPDFPVCNKSFNASYSGHDL